MMNGQFRSLCNLALAAGRERFGAMMGIVSHVYNDAYEIMAVSSDTEIPEVGDRFNLESVYCRQVVHKKRTVAITEIDGVPGMRLHPLYDCIPCEFYISAPIIVASDVWGTLNFTSLAKRDAPFSEADIQFIEDYAGGISNQLRLSS